MDVMATLTLPSQSANLKAIYLADIHYRLPKLIKWLLRLNRNRPPQLLWSYSNHMLLHVHFFKKKKKKCDRHILKKQSLFFYYQTIYQNV